MEVLIKSYRVGPRGDRGLQISIPQGWAKQNGVEKGSTLQVFVNENGDLILRKEKEGK